MKTCTSPGWELSVTKGQDPVQIESGDGGKERNSMQSMIFKTLVLSSRSK